MAGLTANGLEIRTQAELQALLEAAVVEAFPGANVRAGPIQQIIGVLSEELAIAWETLQAVYSAAYPDTASGVLLDAVAALTGTRRRAATASRVTGTVTLAAGQTLAAGAIAAVAGLPDRQFATIADATNSALVEDDVDVVFEALETGALAAPAGTLTVIVSAVAGWTAVTNAADAELGREVAEDDELREQRITELAGAGSGPVDAVRAAVARVDEVIEVAVYENTTSSVDADGRPAKSFEIVLWDGSPTAADDDAIAQAIWDDKPAGMQAHGTTDSGTAVNDADEEKTVDFTRATVLRTYVSYEVVLAPGTGAEWSAAAAAAIVARAEEYSVGETAYASQFTCALLEVSGIVAVLSLAIGTSAPGAAALVEAAYDEIVRVESADITGAS